MEGSVTPTRVMFLWSVQLTKLGKKGSKGVRSFHKGGWKIPPRGHMKGSSREAAGSKNEWTLCTQSRYLRDKGNVPTADKRGRGARLLVQAAEGKKNGSQLEANNSKQRRRQTEGYAIRRKGAHSANGLEELRRRLSSKTLPWKTLDFSGTLFPNNV